MPALYALLAQLIDARARCQRDGNTEWESRHGERIRMLGRDYLPHGSGLDSGTTVDLDASTGERLVIRADFHHMDEYGSYDGWTEHTVIVTPSLAFGFLVRITGRDRNSIKEYLHDVFHTALGAEVE